MNDYVLHAPKKFDDGCTLLPMEEPLGFWSYELLIVDGKRMIAVHLPTVIWWWLKLKIKWLFGIR